MISHRSLWCEKIIVNFQELLFSSLFALFVIVRGREGKGGGRIYCWEGIDKYKGRGAEKCVNAPACARARERDTERYREKEIAKQLELIIRDGLRNASSKGRDRTNVRARARERERERCNEHKNIINLEPPAGRQPASVNECVSCVFMDLFTLEVAAAYTQREEGGSTCPDLCEELPAATSNHLPPNQCSRYCRTTTPLLPLSLDNTALNTDRVLLFLNKPFLSEPSLVKFLF